MIDVGAWIRKRGKPEATGGRQGHVHFLLITRSRTLTDKEWDRTIFKLQHNLLVTIAKLVY